LCFPGEAYDGFLLDDPVRGFCAAFFPWSLAVISGGIFIFAVGGGLFVTSYFLSCALFTSTAQFCSREHIFQSTNIVTVLFSDTIVVKVVVSAPRLFLVCCFDQCPFC
jgi:hypothetical protein